MSSTSTTGPQAKHAILVPGYWLGGWAWQDVEPGLRAAGITPHSVTLPGLDGSSTDGLTLKDHIDAVIELVSSIAGNIGVEGDVEKDIEKDIVLVGHSGGGLVVQGVIDRCPTRIRRVIYVDSGPMLEGIILRPDAIEDIPLPSWDELVADNASIEGMDDAALAMFRKRAVDHPGGVAGSPVRLANDARFNVPATAICTSLPAEMLQQLIEAGQMPTELTSVRDVRYIDLPTGHWPMFSRPAELAALLCEEISRP